MSENSKLDWEEYEAITQYIYGALGQKYGIKVIGYGRNCKVKGRSGVTYQIDVLTEQSDGEKKHLTAIECKYLKEKVTNETVMKLLCIMEDAGIESGIIVCKVGFTRDTLLYAEHKGIKLVELREAEENDKEFKKTFEIGILNLGVKMKVSRANITKIDFGTKVFNEEKEIMPMYFANLYDSYDKEISFSKYITAYSKELEGRKELLKIITIDIPFDGKLYWRSSGNNLTIEKIEITGFFSISDQSFTRSFRLTDQVWMIMKELFDERHLTLSKSGLIWNLPPNKHKAQ